METKDVDKEERVSRSVSSDLFDATLALDRENFVAKIATLPQNQILLRQLVEIVFEHLHDQQQIEWLTSICLAHERAAKKR